MYGHDRKIVKSRYHDESLLEYLNMKISCNNEVTRRQSKLGFILYPALLLLLSYCCVALLCSTATFNKKI